MSGNETHMEPNGRNVRYAWNPDYGTWEIFSEEGQWLGISAVPKPPPSRLKCFDEGLAEGVVDVTQVNDGTKQRDSSDSTPQRHSDNSATAVPTEDEDTCTSEDSDPTPKASHQHGSEAFTTAPLGLPSFGYDLMAAHSPSFQRNGEARETYRKQRSVPAFENGLSEPGRAPPTHFMDSSSPHRPRDNAGANTLQRTSRDMPSASDRHTIKRRRSVGAAAVSHNISSAQHPQGPQGSHKHSRTVTHDGDPSQNKGYPYLTLFDTQPAREAQQVPFSVKPRPRMATSFHIDPDTHRALVKFEELPPLDSSSEEEETIPPATAGTLHGTLRPVDDARATYALPAASAGKGVRTSTSTSTGTGTGTGPSATLRPPPAQLPPPRGPDPATTVGVTSHDLAYYSTTVCRSLADTIHEQRIVNLRRELVTSMFDGYQEWRRHSRSRSTVEADATVTSKPAPEVQPEAEWRARNEVAADAAMLDTIVRARMNETDTGLGEVMFDNGRKADEDDHDAEPAPSIQVRGRVKKGSGRKKVKAEAEELAGLKDIPHQPEEPSDGYRGWDKRWYSISRD